MVVWSPLRFKCGLEVANRFVIAPLTTNSSHEDGTATDSELAFVRRRAASGFGATISSAAYVEEDGRSWRGIGATHDGHLPRLRALAEAMRAAGGLAVLQVYDGGRIAIPEIIGENRMRAASAIPSLRPGSKTPRAMTSDEVEGLVASFGRAASLARGETLLFLHADSQAAPGAVGSIVRAIGAGACAGAFSLAYADADRTLRWIAWWANLRSRLLRLPYGDQGIFCRREAYERAGGFRDLPVCDDVDLVRRLKREGRFVILPEATTTSARRYRERGALAQMLRVWRVVAGYYLGVSPERLARWYYG